MAYLSTARVSFTQRDLDDILAASHRNNRRRGVTGMLCYYDGSFLQFLEGDATDVDAVYGHIASDPRHTGLISLYRQEIQQRLFSDWSMALARVDVIDPEQRAFCKGLRDLELGGAKEHRELVEPFLASFRAWMR
ncbi:MAG TPA: BLUF domain-containing protein [Phenylobacterium sp.]|nr:BLUF domain-containing protein [Phenylobacterium sp.]